MNSLPNPKIKRGLYVILFISYVCFLISHFLVWGFFINPTSLPIFPEPFTGLDINSGTNSIIGLNGLFLCSYVVSILFFFKKNRKEDQIYYWLSNTLLFITCSAIFIYSLIGVFLDWDWAYLSDLVFGFYLWLFSVLVNLGLMIYLNLKFKK